MALLFVDSFDHYATAGLALKWSANTGGTITGSGRHGSYMSFAATNSEVQKSVTPASNTTFVFGFALRVTAMVSTQTFFAIYESNTSHVSLAINSSGNILICRGGTAGGAAGTTLATSADTIALDGSWNYMELKGTIHDTTGSVELRFSGSGSATASASNVDTRNGGTGVWDNFRFGRGNSASVLSGAGVDDLYVLDQSGSAPLNDFLGDMRVDARFPTAEGNTIDWTPSTGTDNSANVDDATPDDDTTYNSTATVNNKDTFTTQDAPVVGAVIRGVQVNIYAKKSDSGTCSVAPVIRHSGTDYIGTDVALGTAYDFGTQVYETNPGTSAAWVESDFNAAEFGYKRTA